MATKPRTPVFQRIKRGARHPVLSYRAMKSARVGRLNDRILRLEADVETTNATLRDVIMNEVHPLLFQNPASLTRDEKAALRAARAKARKLSAKEGSSARQLTRTRSKLHHLVLN
jgi:hypothetical protein